MRLKLSKIPSTTVVHSLTYSLRAAINGIKVIFPEQF